MAAEGQGQPGLGWALDPWLSAAHPRLVWPPLEEQVLEPYHPAAAQASWAAMDVDSGSFAHDFLSLSSPRLQTN